MAEPVKSEGNSVQNSDERRAGVRRRTKRPSRIFYHEDRPTSLELETDFRNTETKLVILDFLSNQPIERLTARNEPAEEKETKNVARKLSKSSSDASSYKTYRTRHAKLAKSARPLRKQYSLRLKKDVDEYLRQRGNSLDDLTSYSSSSEEGERTSSGLLHQRSYTEGDTLIYSRKKRRQRPISDELKKGITQFKAEGLKHVPDEDKAYKEKRSSKKRPEKLDLHYDRERRLSPVLSPESQVAARLELISQEILTTYPDLFNEQINNKVSLQDLTYEKFAATAKKVLEKYPGGWTRIAIVCYFARELALEDESTDEQLEQLVEFSSKFISETSADWIASQGGWGALGDTDEALSPSAVRRKLKEDPDIVDGLLNDGDQPWLGYARYYGLKVAALAMGVTLAYHMARGY